MGRGKTESTGAARGPCIEAIEARAASGVHQRGGAEGEVRVVPEGLGWARDYANRIGSLRERLPSLSSVLR